MSRRKLEREAIYPIAVDRAIAGPHYIITPRLFVARQYTSNQFRRGVRSRKSLRHWSGKSSPFAEEDRWFIYRWIPNVAMEELNRMNLIPWALEKGDAFRAAEALAGSIEMLFGMGEPLRLPVAYTPPTETANERREKRDALRGVAERALSASWRWHGTEGGWKRQKT